MIIYKCKCKQIPRGSLGGPLKMAACKLQFWRKPSSGHLKMVDTQGATIYICTQLK